jgi:hypothetical protein
VCTAHPIDDLGQLTTTGIIQSWGFGSLTAPVCISGASWITLHNAVISECTDDVHTLSASVFFSLLVSTYTGRQST